VNAEGAAPAQGKVQKKQDRRRDLPGEEMACLQIAIGILGVLLLVFPALTSLRGLTLATIAAGLGLLAGLILAIAGGFMGLKESRQRRATRIMTASGIVLTLTGVILLAASGNGQISWDFPVGAIFLTLGVFADIATHRFRRVLAPSR
jgi:VIT1/CCC1 family predicted Fe2+/Mn2+ transporter